MKKLVQIFILLMLAHAAVAQEDFYNDYIITVSGVASVGGDPDVGCGSGFWYSVDFENGERSQIVAFPLDNGGNYNFSGNLVFSSKNKVKSLFVYEKSEDHDWKGDCKGGNSDQRSIVFNPNYPCHNGTIVHSLGSYSFNTTINIQPLSKSNLKIVYSMNLVNNANQEFVSDPALTDPLPDYGCGGWTITDGPYLDPKKYSFNFSLTSYFDNGSTETIFSESIPPSISFDPGNAISRQHESIYYFIKRPSKFSLAASGLVEIYVTTVDFRSFPRRCTLAQRQSNVGFDFVVTDQEFPIDKTFSFTAYPGASLSQISLKATTFSFPVKYLSGTDNILPYDVASRVTLVGPSSNPSSFYHWVFSTNGTTWNDLPAQFQGQQRIQVSGYDILGADFVNYHAKNIFFKLLVDCSGGESDILTLSGRVSAPNIVSVTPLPDRCYTIPKDGAFKIKFDRPLLTDGTNIESLNILLTDPATPNVTIGQFLNITLDSDNSFECPRGLISDKSYLIRLLGTYLGSATYTDNPTTQTQVFSLVRPQPLTSTLAAEAVHCYGGGDGKITVTASGGAGNYSVECIKPGGETLQLPFGAAATGVIDFLRQGIYSISLRDGNGCSDQSGVKNITISQPASALQIGYSAIADPRGYGTTDGLIQTTVVGGTSYGDKHYTIEWYNPTTALPPSLQNNAVLSDGYQANLTGIGEGSYVLKAYDAQYPLAHPDHRAGCYVESIIFELQQPPPLVVTVRLEHDVTCFGLSNGSLSASAQGGVPMSGVSPYRYQWLIVENGTPRDIAQTNATATDLKAGVYIMKVTDNNNIEKFSDPFTLSQPALLQTQITTSPVSCYGGTDGRAQTLVQGGTLPYGYEWGDGSTTSSINGLSKGTYFILVTDAKGCSASASGNVNSPSPVSSSLSIQDVHCYEGGDGKITATIQGGVGNYTIDYVRPGSASTTTLSLGASATGVIDFLRQGLHSVYVHDGNGCPDRNGAKSVTVNQPSRLYIDRAATTPPRAYGYTDGRIETTVMGGTPYPDKHYTIEWYNPVNPLPSSLQNNAVLANAYQANLQGIGDGSYIMKVYDGQYELAHPDHRTGCVVQSEVFTLKEPPPLVVSIRQDHTVTCYGYDDGELVALADGGVKIPGTVHYQYDWLLVDNGTPRLVGKTDSVANRLKAGVYQIKITDRNDIEKISEPFTLLQPKRPITSTITTEAVHCYGGGDGKIKLIARGGVGNYSFEYTTPTRTEPANISMGSDTTIVLDFLTEGTYTFYVHDSNACNDQEGVKPIVVTQPVAPLRISTSSPTDPRAYGYTDGFIETTIVDGTPYADNHYITEWYDPNNLLSPDLQQNQALAKGYQATIMGLGDGAYILKAYDSQYALAHPDHRAGCFTQSEIIRLIQPPPLIVSIHEHHFVSCNGFNDGSLMANAQGGIKIPGALPYRYEWQILENGIPRAIQQTDSIARQLKSALYRIRIVDKNDIEKISDPFMLVQPDVLQASVTTTPVSCDSGEDGAAEALVAGGTLPYAYAWSDGSTTPGISRLIEGKYFVWIKDNRGCTTSASAKVTAPSLLKIDSVVLNPQCYGYSNGAIDLTVAEGTAPYTYAWNTGATTEDIRGIQEGNYRVLIVDGNGCRNFRIFKLRNPEPVQIELGSDRYLCNNQQYEADATWKDPASSYVWTGPDGYTSTTAKPTLTKEGIYQVHVTDSKGCEGKDQVTVKRLAIDISSEFIVSTQAFTKTEVTLLNISSPVPDSVTWWASNTTDTNFIVAEQEKATLLFANEGVYTLYMKAYRQGCEAIFSKVVTVLEKAFDDDTEVQLPFVETFTVYPIPTQSVFTVSVVLQEVASIRLRLISTVTNVVLSDRKEQGSNSYQLEYNLNLPSGTYMLLMETQKGNDMIKLIVN